MLVFYILLFLILSAFFSGSEIAFVSANKLGIELKREKGGRRGKIMARFYDKPESFLSTMLVGNNIALVIFTILIERLLNPVIINFPGGDASKLLLTTLAGTLIVLIFGEFLPKTIFRIYANDVIFLFTYPLQFFRKFFYPVTAIINRFTNYLLKVFTSGPIQDVEHILTRFDLEHFVAGDGDSQSEEIETDMFKNVLHLKQTKVREIMVPRNEIIYIDVSDPISDLLSVFQDSGHSRIIVVDDDINNILGYVHHQQLLTNPKSIRKIMFQIPIIPETVNIQDLLIRFIKEQSSLAWVVDEFGGTAGIVTLEDILEEIFGEIEDEHDEEIHTEIMINDGEFIFSGRLEIDYLNDKYEPLEFPEGDYTTLSGYIVMTTGSIPNEGDEIDLGKYKFVLESVSEKKIETVRVIVTGREQD